MCKLAPRGVRLVHGEGIRRVRIYARVSSIEDARRYEATIDLEPHLSRLPVNLHASLAARFRCCPVICFCAHWVGSAATEVPEISARGSPTARPSQPTYGARSTGSRRWIR